MNKKLAITSLSFVLFVAFSCGGGHGPGSGTVGPTASGTALAPDQACQCAPTEPASSDFRHNQKHMPIPNITPQEITVNTILGWPQGPNPGSNAPRTGRELQVFHIAQAFLQNVFVLPNDCDIHFELSQTADPNAPRVIVETPIDGEFCPARQNVASALAAHGISLFLHNGTNDLAVPLRVEVLGMAFQDFEHSRGTVHVTTVWELHPAVVTFLE